MHRRFAVMAGLALALPVTAATPPIKPVAGLVITATVHATLVSNQSVLGVQDTEELTSVTELTPDVVGYQLHFHAPSNASLDDVMKKYKIIRRVNRSDMEQSQRMTLLWNTRDPESYAGQTFVDTSRKTLQLIATSGETPFVVGTYEASSLMRMFAPVQASLAAAGAQNKDGAMSGAAGALSMLDEARHYFRGTLRRVPPGTVPVSVLVNGVRTDLPAVHVAGSLSFGTEAPVPAEFWWFDNPDYPLTLRWMFGPASSVVTRIDYPTGASAAEQTAALAKQLGGASCRVELHGIYFNSGSAVLLDESEPMLKTVAAVIKASTEPTLRIEGHTDNIGAADYNQKLSEQRAEAVRQALVARFGIAASRLTAQGYGLTRPVESNATFEGRARNRRVEVARPCPAAH
jgi:outer membrane protein OmpA-like peptidoglycan-associated protein